MMTYEKRETKMNTDIIVDTEYGWVLCMDGTSICIK